MRPPVSGDEAQRTLEHTNDQPHLTTVDETLTVETARAKGTITINLGNHQHPCFIHFFLSLAHLFQAPV